MNDERTEAEFAKGNRLECLKLAEATCARIGEGSEEILAVAAKYADFVEGKMTEPYK